MPLAFLYYSFVLELYNVLMPDTINIISNTIVITKCAFMYINAIIISTIPNNTFYTSLLHKLWDIYQVIKY